MSDKKKTEVSVMPEFVSGEQPTAAKFNAMGALIKRESFVLEKCVGDIWGESEPYTVYTGNLLSIPIFQSSMRNIIPNANDATGRSLDIVSLGRAIGSMSKLNPKFLTDGLNDGTGDFENIGEIVETIDTSDAGGCQYTLRYKPAAPGGIVFSDGVVFHSLVSANNLLNPGDYSVQASGIIYTVTPIVAGATITYKVQPELWSGGSSYIGSSFNTIPDINQVGFNDLIISQPIGSVYEITFPNVTMQTANYDESSTSLTPNDVNYEGLYKLPAAIIAVCGGDYTDSTHDGDQDAIIPEGMIYLRNATTGETYSDAIYYYNNESGIKVEGVELDLSDSYYLITVGTDITSSIEDLYKKQFKHSHSREFGEPLVSVEDLDDIYKEKPESGNYFPSNIPGNHFSQYLHRDGFHRDSSSASYDNVRANDNNCMRGDLLIGRYNAGAGNYLSGGVSHKIIFGHDEGSSTNRDGPTIYNTYSGGGGSNEANTLNISSIATYALKSNIEMEANDHLEIKSRNGLVSIESTGNASGGDIEVVAKKEVEITSTTGDVNINTGSGAGNVILDADNANIADEGLVMRHRSTSNPIGSNVGGWSHPAMKCAVYESSSGGDRFYGYYYPGSNREILLESSVNVIEREIYLDGLGTQQTVLGYQCLVSSDRFSPNMDTLASWVASGWVNNEIRNTHWIPINASHPGMVSWGFMNSAWSPGVILDYILNTIGLGRLMPGPPSVGGISYDTNTNKFRISIAVDLAGTLGAHGPSHIDRNQTSIFSQNSNNEYYHNVRVKLIVWYR